MNIIRSSIRSQVLDLKTLSIFSPLKGGVINSKFVLLPNVQNITWFGLRVIIVSFSVNLFSQAY